MFAKYLLMYTAVSAAMGVAATEAVKAVVALSQAGQTTTFRDSVRSDGDVSNDEKDRSKSE